MGAGRNRKEVTVAAGSERQVWRRLRGTHTPGQNCLPLQGRGGVQVIATPPGDVGRSDAASDRLLVPPVPAGGVSCPRPLPARRAAGPAGEPLEPRTRRGWDLGRGHGGTRDRGRLVGKAGAQEAPSVLRMRGYPRPLKSARSGAEGGSLDGGWGRRAGTRGMEPSGAGLAPAPPVSPLPTCPPSLLPGLGSPLGGGAGGAVAPSALVSRDMLFAKVGPGVRGVEPRGSGGRTREGPASSAQGPAQ